MNCLFAAHRPHVVCAPPLLWTPVCLHVGAGPAKQSQHTIRLERVSFIWESQLTWGIRQLSVTISRACIQSHITAFAVLDPSFEVLWAAWLIACGVPVAGNTSLLGSLSPGISGKTHFFWKKTCVRLSWVISASGWKGGFHQHSIGAMHVTAPRQVSSGVNQAWNGPARGAESSGLSQGRSGQICFCLDLGDQTLISAFFFSLFWYLYLSLE